LYACGWRATYSRLRGHERPRFFSQYLKMVDAQVAASRVTPAFGNTGADGLYLVFEEVEDGADFALRLRDAIAGNDWSSAGLPTEMTIRIGMHTGLAFRVMDPIIRRESYFRLPCDARSTHRASGRAGMRWRLAPPPTSLATTLAT
jgi:hypothetical protein